MYNRQNKHNGHLHNRRSRREEYYYPSSNQGSNKQFYSHGQQIQMGQFDRFDGFNEMNPNLKKINDQFQSPGGYGVVDYQNVNQYHGQLYHEDRNIANRSKHESNAQFGDVYNDYSRYRGYTVGSTIGHVVDLDLDQENTQLSPKIKKIGDMVKRRRKRQAQQQHQHQQHQQQIEIIDDIDNTNNNSNNNSSIRYHTNDIIDRNAINGTHAAHNNLTQGVVLQFNNKNSAQSRFSKDSYCKTGS